MRLLLPERISLRWTLVVALALVVAEVLEGTDARFAGMQGLYILLWIIAFNLARGFRSAVGAYVFWFGLLTIPIGAWVKVVVNEPADSNSWAPLLSMSVYVVSMAMLIVSVAVARKLTRNVPSLAERITPREFDYRSAAIGSFMVWLAITNSGLIFEFAPGSVAGAIGQVNYFGDLAMLLASIDAIRSSGGRRLSSPLVWFIFVYLFIIGVAVFAKEGMFTPLVCWLIGIAWTRFRLRLIHIASITAIIVFSFTVLYPVSQVGRALVPQGSTTERLEFAVSMVENIGYYRALNREDENMASRSEGDYFTKGVGFWNRLTRWPGDDRLIAYSNEGHYVGYDLIWYSFINWIPHILLPKKDAYAPAARNGNYYAREVGMINSHDTTTGISFGTEAEAFHMAGWQGVLLMQPLVWTFSFVILDLVCGDIKRAPWGLIFALLLGHLAPEGALAGLLYFDWYSSVGLIMCMSFSIYLAPLIGSALTANSSRLPARPLPAPGIS